jgi:hypothetical protein
MSSERDSRTGQVLVVASLAVALATCAEPPFDGSDDSNVSNVSTSSAELREQGRGGAGREERRRCQLPDGVPAPLAVPEGQCLKLETFAVGVQIYTCAAGAWVLRAPEANLNDRHGNFLGNHFLGPTWQANDGSKVKGARLAQVPAPTGAQDIPWLLLNVVGGDGAGRLEDVTFIQRLHTAGGVAPAGPCATEGAEVRVAYTAEYLFYRAAGHGHH